MPAADLEGQIRDTFPQLTRWGELAKQAFSPQAGSPLALDDQVFEWLPTSDIAWQGLCAAQDHLKGFRAWFLSNDAAADPEAGPGLFPIATYVARSSVEQSLHGC